MASMHVALGQGLDGGMATLGIISVDWEEPVENMDMVYCATIALGRYSLHSSKIHYIQDGNLCLYMWHHLL